VEKKRKDVVGGEGEGQVFWTGIFFLGLRRVRISVFVFLGK
jgi:hypothetical protein